MDLLFTAKTADESEVLLWVWRVIWGGGDISRTIMKATDGLLQRYIASRHVGLVRRICGVLGSLGGVWLLFLFPLIPRVFNHCPSETRHQVTNRRQNRRV